MLASRITVLSAFVLIFTFNFSSYSQTENSEITLDENDWLYLNGEPQISLNTYLDNSDSQTVTMDGDVLKVSNGGQVNLGHLRDNTDQQFMYKFGHTLFLQDGSQVNFDNYMDNTDQQTIDAEIVDNTKLKINISNGNEVALDLSPLLSNQQAQIRDLTRTLLRMEERLTALEGCACGERLDDGQNAPKKNKVNTDAKAGPQAQDVAQDNKARLFQNIPNPFQSTSSIKYFVPENAKNAVMQFSNTSGKFVYRVDLSQKGNGTLDINTADLSKGIYLYTLYIDGKSISTRKMIIE